MHVSLHGLLLRCRLHNQRSAAHLRRVPGVGNAEGKVLVLKGGEVLKG